MAAAPLEQTFWETFCDLIGLEPELHDEEKFYGDESSCCRNHCDREVSWRSPMVARHNIMPLHVP